MIFALILTPIIVLFATGGTEPTFAAIELKDAANFDMLKGASFVGVVSLMAWGLGYFGQPHILARFMAADSVKSIPAARRISMTWMILCLGGAVAVGFFGIAYFSAHPEQAGAVSENHERVFIELAKILFNPWIAGVLLSAILAAVMSTLSCQLLVCSSALTEDFYKAFLRKNASQLELVWVGRAMVLLVALIAIALAVLAAQDRLRLAVLAYGVALAVLLLAHPGQGGVLMAWLDGLRAAIALVLLRSIRPAARGWLPWRARGAAGGALLAIQAAVLVAGIPGSPGGQWLAAVGAAVLVGGAAWWASPDLRSALAR
jgi:sodium/proline symporter